MFGDSTDVQTHDCDTTLRLQLGITHGVVFGSTEGVGVDLPHVFPRLSTEQS